MAISELPPGYRPVEQEDLAVGKDVLYLTNGSYAKAKILEVTVKDQRIKLDIKSGAQLKRVFVIDEAEAAVGAQATGCDGARGEVEAVGSTVARSSSSAAPNDDEVPQGDRDEADQFLVQVADWISSLEGDGSSSLPECLGVVLEGNGTPDDVAKAFKDKVQWVPCLNFQTVPKFSKRGHMHISMLSYQVSSYVANGMFVGDAKLLLKAQGLRCLEGKTISIKPRAGANPTCFGWEVDGPVENSTIAFAMTCIVAYCLHADCTMPQPLARLLKAVPVHFYKHDTAQERLVSNLVASATQRHVNRTIQCPIFLAEELSRFTFQPTYVKTFVKLYQQRMMMKPSLQLPARTEDCVIRVMTPTKTCPEAVKSLTRAVVRFTWHDGPWVVGHIMSAFFPIGSNLNNSTHEQWAKLNVQSARGQTLALEVGNALFEASKKKMDYEDDWSIVLVACGLWVQVKEKLLPSLLLSAAALGALDKALQNDPGFRSDLAAVSSREPPLNLSSTSDLAGWLMTHVSELRHAKQADLANVGATGESHPSKLLGDKEAADLAAFNYVSGCWLDVKNYREATKKFGEESDMQEKQWRTLHENM